MNAKSKLMVKYADGVIEMSREIDGLVETSLNLGDLKTENECVSFTFLLRSGNNSERKKLTENNTGC